MTQWIRLAALLILACGQAGLAAAGPTDAVGVELPPTGQGAIFSPAIRLVADLEPAYLEEEFFVSGNANVYTYDDPPVRDELLVLQPDVPYKTRIIVRRPADPSLFNGTVIIEWWNSTAGFDTAPVWDPSAEYYAREGIVYVGVTNSATSIGHLVGGCLLFGLLPPPLCGTRYLELSLPENGAAFEMVSQIAHLLKTPAAPNPLYPDYPVERIFHAGQSQQGGSMVTYATAFHFPDNDGYFVQAAGSARPINFAQPACDPTDPGVPAYPACTPRLEDDDRRVRTDLSVPVYRAQTETDMGSANTTPPRGVIGGDSRQTDSGEFRYYEMSGTAHVTVHEDTELIPGLFLEDVCRFPLNTLADGPIFGSVLYNAMWDNMERQVRDGMPPPSASPIEVAGGDIVRDAFGNARGGIRVPQLDVPVATYGPVNEIDPAVPPLLAPLLDLFCRLSGTVDPFDAATLASLYPNAGVLASRLADRADALHASRFLLPEDASVVIPQTLLTGRRFVLRDNASDPSRRRLRMRSRDPSVWAPSPGGLGDPVIHGAVLRVANPATSESSEIPLDASGWRGLGNPAGSRGYRFRGATCPSVTVRSGVLSVNCRGSGVGISLDEASQGSIATSLQLGYHSPLCVEFGGAVSRDRSNAEARGRGSFSAANAPTPSDCSAQTP
ncbi:MAG: hypothetical protein JRG83_09015 [Deltaproteobacteria bacterium]|nr:hypothetical protein [Deltaproteobacteria bacterium]